MIPRPGDYFRITKWAFNKKEWATILPLDPSYELGHSIKGATIVRRKITNEDLEGEFGKYLRGQARKLKRIDGKEMMI